MSETTTPSADGQLSHPATRPGFFTPGEWVQFNTATGDNDVADGGWLVGQIPTRYLDGLPLDITDDRGVPVEHNGVWFAIDVVNHPERVKHLWERDGKVAAWRSA
jgi:hypothetical protein